tara:strand:+ start:168 stop:785 length:618 start_codon:yes stop_codon:yes gene_type:complete
MNFITRFFSFIIICILFSSCKNEVKSTVENVDNGSTEAVINPIPEMKEIKVVIESEMNSVMVKSMITPELKTFSSMLVTTGLVEMLSKKEGPFTIIGPSSEAFTRLGQLQMTELLNTTHKDELVRLIKSHIIDGNLDSETLVQRIKEGRGSYEIIAMSGATYIASRDGEIIILTDVQGVSGQIEKSDINASNGVVHVLDTVLGLN